MLHYNYITPKTQLSIARDQIIIINSGAYVCVAKVCAGKWSCGKLGVSMRRVFGRDWGEFGSSFEASFWAGFGLVCG